MHLSLTKYPLPFQLTQLPLAAFHIIQLRYLRKLILANQLSMEFHPSVIGFLKERKGVIGNFIRFYTSPIFPKEVKKNEIKIIHVKERHLLE